MATRKTARPTRSPPPTPGVGDRANPAALNAGAPNGLGARLRLGRERSGATVRGLARAVGVSPSLVSQIERGKVMPSVGTLYAITNELGLLVDDVFKDVGPAAAASAPGRQARRPSAQAAGPVQSRQTRRSIRLASGVRWELLTAEPDDELDFLYVVYDVGGESCSEDSMVRHGGKEYAYLISGRLGVKIGFNDYELGPGDSISFDAQLPHRLWAIGDQPAVAIWAVLNRRGDLRTQASAVEARRQRLEKA